MTVSQMTQRLSQLELGADAYTSLDYSDGCILTVGERSCVIQGWSDHALQSVKAIVFDLAINHADFHITGIVRTYAKPLLRVSCPMLERPLVAEVLKEEFGDSSIDWDSNI